MGKNIILHCSDSAWGDAAIINEWHKARGWEKIGYHKVILNGLRKSSHDYDKSIDGKIEDGRKLDEIGCHCYGHNDAIGICLIGKSGKFTDEQIVACFYELKNLKKKFKEIEIYQHSDFDKKKSFCAGFIKMQMEQFRKV
jgi:N-acetylmuramoyl-L-alanine amidase